MYYGIDSYYLILVLPAIIFSLIAQRRVNSAFDTYSKVHSRRGITGADAAHAVLRLSGITNVQIERISGSLTDHFDPKTNTIRLSQSVYDASTVAAIGVAAHEAGHAVQYAHGYGPIRLRAAIIPITQFGSSAAMPLIFVGLFLNTSLLIDLGLIFFFTSVVFQLVTLPVEFNASNRAIEAIAEAGLLYEDELPGARKTLSAAALTYVAALMVALAQFLRLLMIFGRRRDD